MKVYKFSCHYKMTFKDAPVEPIIRTINLDLIEQHNGEFQPESLDNWSKNLVNVMEDDLKVLCSPLYVKWATVGGTLIIKDIHEQPIFTLILNSVESFKSCLEFLKRKDFDNQIATHNTSLLNPAASAIVHKFDNHRHSRKVISTEQVSENDSMCHSVCRRITNLFT